MIEPRNSDSCDLLPNGGAESLLLRGPGSTRGAIHAGWATVMGVLLAGGIYLLILDRGSSAAPPESTPEPSVGRGGDVVGPDLSEVGISERSAAAQPPEANRAVEESARQVIEREFGLQAADAIRKLEAKGWDLDRLGPPQLTWEEARLKLEARLMPTEAEERAWLATIMAWPEQLTGPWIREHFSLGEQSVDPQDVDAIEALVSTEVEEARAIAAEMARLRRMTLQRAWDQDRFTHRPFVILKEKRKNAFYAKSDLEGGWAYGLFLEWDDCPGLFDMYREAQMLALRRDDRIREYLKARR